MKPQNFQQFAEAKKEKLSLPETAASEQKITPESKEKLSEKERERLKKEVLAEIKETERPAKKIPSSKPGVKPPPAVKSPALLKIESILEEDLKDVYFKMKPDLQQKFKTEGEEIAVKIEEILKQAKVKAKKIFKLILNWLKIIPGVNKFFIKQETKIKTDKLIKLK